MNPREHSAPPPLGNFPFLIENRAANALHYAKDKTMGENYKCDICGAPATVHLTQIVDGKIHKVHLCEKCAAKSQVAELPILKFTEMLAKTLAAGGKKNSPDEDAAETVGREPKKICPVCGTTDIIFEKKNLFGCPHCYEVFSEKIDEILPKIQKGKTYCGNASPAKKKNPRGGNVPAKTESAEDLRARLKAAVANEDYALAARLRDAVRAAEKSAVPAKKSGAEKKKNPAKNEEKSARKTKVRAAEKPSPKRSRARGKKSEGGNAA